MNVNILNGIIQRHFHQRQPYSYSHVSWDYEVNIGVVYFDRLARIWYEISTFLTCGEQCETTAKINFKMAANNFFLITNIHIRYMYNLELGLSKSYYQS